MLKIALENLKKSLFVLVIAALLVGLGACSSTQEPEFAYYKVLVESAVDVLEIDELPGTEIIVDKHDSEGYIIVKQDLSLMGAQGFGTWSSFICSPINPRDC